MSVYGCSDGQQEQQGQQPGEADTAAGDDGIENAVEQNAGVEHSQHESIVAKDGMGADRIENAHHEYRDSGLIEHFLAPDQGNENVKHGGGHRQHLIGPDIDAGDAVDAFQNDPGNGGEHQHGSSDPGDGVLPADKQADFSFHRGPPFSFFSGGYIRAFRRPAIKAGSVPQQPPKRFAPMALQSRRMAVKSSGVMG